MTDPVIVVEDLTVRTRSGAAVLAGVSLAVRESQSLGLVGESGSGKTTLAHALLGYTRPGLELASGSVRVAGEELVGRSDRGLRPLRGRLISYVPQDPAAALNPGMRVGAQIREMLRVHARDRDADRLARKLLERVELPSDDAFQRRFPHQLSGGQQQRVAIAIALACEPRAVVLDEPTTGLDVITQGLILEEVSRLRNELDVALVYVSHDLAAVSTVTDRVAVMYSGQIVEQADLTAIIGGPRHPYTAGLISSVPDHRRPQRLVGIPGVAPEIAAQLPGCLFAPRCGLRIDECERARPAMTEAAAGHLVRCLRWAETAQSPPLARQMTPPARQQSLLAVTGLTARHRTRGLTTTAVDGVSFKVWPGSCVALVGESGSGKTTIARCVAGLHAPDAGSIEFGGERLAAVARRRTREQRRRIQLISQNPYESLNPRHTIADQIGWPARALRGVSKRESESEVALLLERVRLPARLAERYPGSLSGGERQRVAIARALAAQPDLLVCDEITSALDVSVQAAALDLLHELQAELGLALLFITHDLGVVAAVADDVLVLEHGTQVESGETVSVLHSPAAAYTRRLIGAAPTLPLVTPESGAPGARAGATAPDAHHSAAVMKHHGSDTP
jgi:peptide/nickel transport system ATP-binding protein